MSSITEQVHDNAAFGDSFVHLEQVGAWNPTILYCLFPRCAILSHTNYDVETIIAEIQTLPVTLGAVADKSKGVVFEVVLNKV